MLQIIGKVREDLVPAGIVGGTNAIPGAWPLLVSLKHRHKGHQCGGSVIGPRWILSAGQCFDHFNLTDFTIIAGKINRLFELIKFFFCNRNGRIEVTPK